MQPAVEFLTPTFTEILLFFVTLVLFVASWKDLRRSLVMTFASRHARLRALRILNEIEGSLGGYLLTVTLINMGVGIATGLICAITGMPNPAGLGALAATLNFFPIIGPVAMFVVLVVVGIVAFPTLGAGLLAALAFAGLTFLEGHFVTPTIIGRRLALNALPGDAGGPVFDDGGAVMGMLLPQEDGMRQLPGDVSFAMDSATLRAVLQPAGITPRGATPSVLPIAPEDLDREANGMTVLVSCW